MTSIEEENYEDHEDIKDQRPLQTKGSSPRGSVDDDNQKSVEGLNYKKLFIHNIDYDSNEDDIRQLFFKFGPTVSFQVPRDNKNRIKGLAFVEYENEEDSRNAQKETSDFSFGARKLKVEFANPNKEGKFTRGHQGNFSRRGSDMRGQHGYERRRSPSYEQYQRSYDRNQRDGHREVPREGLGQRDDPRDAPRDALRDPPRDPTRDPPREPPREPPRDGSRDVNRNSSRNGPRDGPERSYGYYPARNDFHDMGYRNREHSPGVYEHRGSHHKSNRQTRQRRSRSRDNSFERTNRYRDNRDFNRRDNFQRYSYDQPGYDRNYPDMREFGYRRGNQRFEPSRQFTPRYKETIPSDQFQNQQPPKDRY